MLFDPKLAEQICHEMGIAFDPNQKGITIGGKIISNNFSAEKLFRGEYEIDDCSEITRSEEYDFKYDSSFSDDASYTLFVDQDSFFPNESQLFAIAA